MMLRIVDTSAGLSRKVTYASLVLCFCRPMIIGFEMELCTLYVYVCMLLANRKKPVDDSLSIDMLLS